MKRGTVCFKLVNLSPSALNPNFELEITNYAIKRLEKEGYHYTIKNPQYEVILEMLLDSSLNHGLAYYNIGKSQFNYNYSRVSPCLNLRMEAHHIKTSHLVWEDKYDLYYFYDFRRDLFRSKGVIKYMLSSINDEK